MSIVLVSLIIEVISYAPKNKTRKFEAVTLYYSNLPHRSSFVVPLQSVTKLVAKMMIYNKFSPPFLFPSISVDEQ